MGRYINIGNTPFSVARNGEYIDKSLLIAEVNATLNSEREFSCVTRSRRFGKSMAAKMLCAYYDKSCDSRSLFADLAIANHPTFKTHLNRYRVVYIDMSDFVSRFKDREDIVEQIQRTLIEDIVSDFPDTEVKPQDVLSDVLLRLMLKNNEKTILIIDEWDAICREFRSDSKAMDNYISWFRSMFKDVNSTRIFAGVYLTGILPIKKYRTESALNNFWEYSMILPRRMDRYFGFTKSEVAALADKHGMRLCELERWYDGYRIGLEAAMFNPNSVIQAIYSAECRSFWSATGSYEQVATYIDMNFDGLRNNIIDMLGGGRCPVDTTGFSNDMHDVNSKDDVLTVLIHLGYLSYDAQKEECFIPNYEVRRELENAVKSRGWKVAQSLITSKRLLQATLSEDEEAVAKGIEQVHDEHTSILSYHDENSLACVLSIAYYYAQNDYILHRELPTGKGFADIVLIPRNGVTSPALVVELKCDGNVDSALSQIRQKDYVAKVADYTDHILLVGINYDRKSKAHTCRIEKWQ